MGRSRSGPASRIAWSGGSPCSRTRTMARSTSRIAFFVTRPMSRMMPIIEPIAIEFLREEEAEDGADDRERQRHHDRERVDEALELRGEHEVDEDDAEQEREAH